jgi:murein DD-endopeptidase MepM/ murein hydrolase activator NlpD
MAAPARSVSRRHIAVTQSSCKDSLRHEILNGRAGVQVRFVGRSRNRDARLQTNRFSLALALLRIWAVAAVTLLLLHPLKAAAGLLLNAPLPSPVSPACISSPFGARILEARPHAGTFHNGIDIPAPAGASVRAVASGTVIRVQRRGPGGLQILVQHPGFIGIYSHLGMVTPAIAEGQRVVHTGDQLGVVGHSGVTYGMHLFFGMIVGNRAVDPAPYLALSLCGTTHRIRADMLAPDGKIPPIKAYAAGR